MDCSDCEDTCTRLDCLERGCIGGTIEAQPETVYNPDQQRVADWIVARTGGMIGAGEDPIGFLLASYEDIHIRIKYLEKLYNFKA